MPMTTQIQTYHALKYQSTLHKHSPHNHKYVEYNVDK